MAVSFFICLLTCGLGFVSEASAVEAAPFIWWSAAPVERLTDGRTSQVLTLLTTSGHRLSQPEAYYRVTPLRRFNQVDRSGEALWYRGEWISTDPWVLRVEADGYVRVDVLAKAMIAGQPHWAQTWALLYSRSGKKEPRPAGMAKPSGWPEFEVQSTGELYWPQTGHEFSVKQTGVACPAENLLAVVEVADSRSEVLARLTPSSKVFKYTPPHDQALDRAGDAASKPLIFLASEESGGSASFTIAIHRSRVAGLDAKAGLMVFAAAFLLTALAAVWSRRKVASCH